MNSNRTKSKGDALWTSNPPLRPNKSKENLIIRQNRMYLVVLVLIGYRGSLNRSKIKK